MRGFGAPASAHFRVDRRKGTLENKEETIREISGESREHSVSEDKGAVSGRKG